jgi:predicted nucleotidyltransferase
MSTAERSLDDILRALQERAKELSCLYRVDEVLNRKDVEWTSALRELVQIIPRGWQYPDHCVARIQLEGRIFEPKSFEETPWGQHADIVFEGDNVGEISVYYTERMPNADEGPFLKEERRLINAIAERIGYLLLQRQLKRALPPADPGGDGRTRPGRWGVILDFLRSTDRTLLRRITRRMVNHLCWNGVKDAERLLLEFAPEAPPLEIEGLEDNRPLTRARLRDLESLAETTFDLASRHLSEEEVFACIQTWIKEDKASFLSTALENLDTPLQEIADAVARFHSLSVTEGELPMAVQVGMRVALMRRFFSDQLDLLNRARDYVTLEDFHDLIRRVVFLPQSHGKLGGKSAGLFVASRIVARSTEYQSILSGIKVPKTWYVTSDGLLQLLQYNNMEDVYDHKYREIDQIRQEYPSLVQIFKACAFPPELTRGLAVALDDFEGRPIIVRSSSLLEDRVGSAFSGKYKSLFLANKGTKRERLAALQDAIAEVYASVFGPDPIEYRAERNLLDVHEEMGIMIQEVVGRPLGKYFLPAFSGVAYSHNEYRWSSRIRREDGLVRMVPGLGTRAVDRLADDYPILITPGQPGLRANVTPDEILRYSPKKIDVINLETREFESIDLDALLREHGNRYPQIRKLVSEVSEGHVRAPMGLRLDFSRNTYVMNFEGLVADTAFVVQMRTLLQLLQERLGVPVDIEFASDGESFYLLQCRAQGHTASTTPATIPLDVQPERVLFTAHRYVSNGYVSNITHVVYVDDDGYSSLPDAASIRSVGTTVGRLNALLPKRQFILMGPGRWGSRGDIRMGVPVTYSQINNTAMLVEIARKKGNYVPDLSFGTHFFQDLVEADIRYLPLYPDDPRVVFNEAFFRESENVLPSLLPDAAGLSETVRVIDVPAQTGGEVLSVLMNADSDSAMGLLAPRAAVVTGASVETPPATAPAEEHWRWRMRMAERIAREVDVNRFGVHALYVFGSTKNATAGPGSDIDLLVHFVGDERQRECLTLWLEGWSQCLSEINYLRTGYRTEGLLDVHVVTDDDIAAGTSYATKIKSVTDPARPLPLGKD